MSTRALSIVCLTLIVSLSGCGGSSSPATDNSGDQPAPLQPSIAAIGDQELPVDSVVSITPVIANPGAGIASFSVEPQPLPAGLMFDTISGELSGVPVEAGSTPITISLSIDGSLVDSNSFQLAITANPTAVAATVDSTQFPLLADDGNVSWAFAPRVSDLQVHLAPFVEMPLGTNGEPARWNDLVILGERIFVLQEYDGHVYEITDGQIQLWFDAGTAIQASTGRNLDLGNTWQSGLRSLAFHPEFASNGKFYTTVMEQRPANAAEHTYLSDAAAIDADGVLIEWTANPDTMVVDASSYREVFRIGIPQYDHPIKQIEFDPYATPDDANYGLLYIAHGDGGADFSITSGGLGNDALGKILRINPLATATANYSVPSDNPFINDASMLDEVYSLGHRNPHHMAFTKDRLLISAEAGGDNIDEINLIESGGNYGWSQREGSYVYLSETSTLYDGIAPLPANDADFGYRYPVAQYGHVGMRGRFFLRVALAGGYVVENGSPLDGQYFYTEFATLGDLFHSSLTDLRASVTTGSPAELSMAQTFRATLHFDHDNNPDTTPQRYQTLAEIIKLADGYTGTDRLDIRIGQGPRGELYITSKRNNMVYLVTSSLPGGPGGFSADSGPMETQPPVAADDRFAIEDLTQNQLLDVLANDSDPTQLALDIVLESGESALGGQLSLEGSSILYNPPPNLSADDTFTYQAVNSDNQLSNIAIVTLTPPAPVTSTAGQALYDSACMSCHSQGFPNAPQLGDSAAWSQRLTQAGGIDGLVDSVVNGLNTMPAFGTTTNSRAELQEAVEYLIGG